MIGVIHKTGQAPLVAEFFELFKTPWEFYEQGRQYDVIIATTHDIPEVDTRLLVLYGPDSKKTDFRDGITLRSRDKTGSLGYKGLSLPIYGELATFDQRNFVVELVSSAAGVTGLRLERGAAQIMIRLGYDLFQEVQFLLASGQPVEHARIPTLDLHIRILRDLILNQGIPLIEIPPAPAGHSFAVCLTHDIDFVGIRQHKFDHTMWGFLYRSTIGSVRNLLRGRISIGRLLESWRSAASLPFVYLGWVKDFWAPFEWYLSVEKGLPATYFLIPFKRRAGDRVPGRHASRRATAYDVGDIPQWIEALRAKGCELGVHGIDSWHNVDKGRAELARLAGIVGESSLGVRMHWLLQDANTASVLEKSGYTYDATSGYNETVGYRSGTTQVFRPLGAGTLLELPLHIQDGALFYHERLDLSPPEAERRCRGLIDNAEQFGGVVTVLWHDRSHAAERFWGGFYIKLIQILKSCNPWFASAAQVVGWYRKRRGVYFERIGAGTGVRLASRRSQGEELLPQLTLRIHRSSTPAGSSREIESTFVDVPWNARTVMEFDSSLARISEVPAESPRELLSLS